MERAESRHFDVTTPLWITEEHKEVKAIKYLPVLGYESSEMPQGGKEFSEETIALVDYYNIIRDWKFKPGEEVVLLDPLSGKPVNLGEITDYDIDAKTYEVSLNRLNNRIPFTWPEDFITAATQELIEKANTLLTEIEFASDHLLSDIDTKNKPEETVIEIPLSVPEYIVYYKQMNIDGALKWRLLTLKKHTSDR